MKNTTLIALNIILLLFLSCEKTTIRKDYENNKKTDIKIKSMMKNNLPYTSENVKPYYKLDSDSISYVVDLQNNGIPSNNFEEKNNSVPLKENDFDIQLNSKYTYYELETFKFSNTNTAKLIIYNTFGENDSKILNVQLNSYINNILVDKLLLECRFTFETEYYRIFKIDADKDIEIVKYSVNGIEYNEAGDIIGQKQNADTIKTKVEYSIDSNGIFIKK